MIYQNNKIVGEVKYGSKNWLWNTNRTITSDSYLIASYLLVEKPTVGDTFTCTIWGNLNHKNQQFFILNSNDTAELRWLNKISEGVYSGVFQWKNTDYSGELLANDTSIRVYVYNSSLGPSTINKIKLEKGANYNPIYNEYDADINEIYYYSNLLYKRKYIEGILVSTPNNEDEHKIRLVYNNGNWELKVIPYTLYNQFHMTIPDNSIPFIYGNELSKIKKIKVVATTKYYNISEMFYGCTNLEEIDVSEFDVSNITNMTTTFYMCSGLTSIDLSTWNVSNVTTFDRIFFNCNNLETINLNNWQTSSIKNMRGMFTKCYKLKNIYGLSNLDVSKNTSMWNLFRECNEITTLDLSTWDTSNVQNMLYCFKMMNKLTTLDLSTWNTSKLWTSEHLFYNCPNLKSINISSWDLSNAIGSGNDTMKDMFYKCTSLTDLQFGYNFKVSLSFADCPLTHDSALSVINGLATITTTETITFKLSTYNTLTPNEIAIATAKGWTITSA